MDNTFHRLFLKAIVVASIGTPLVCFFNVPIWIPIVVGVCWILFDEIGRID